MFKPVLNDKRWVDGANVQNCYLLLRYHVIRTVLTPKGFQKKTHIISTLAPSEANLLIYLMYESEVRRWWARHRCLPIPRAGSVTRRTAVNSVSQYHNRPCKQRQRCGSAWGDKRARRVRLLLSSCSPYSPLLLALLLSGTVWCILLCHFWRGWVL